MDTGDSAGARERISSARSGARRWMSRRSVLIAGASGLAVTGVAAASATGNLPFAPAIQRAAGVASATPTSQVGTVKVERVYSAARGREIDLLMMFPTKTPQPGLPMSLLLHGLHGNARHSAPTGLLKELAGEVARHDVPPFGFVAVDGGDNYWHQYVPGDDPMAMLLEEVPEWLRQRGVGDQDGLPFAASGLSMGGFGAMLYARRRVERRQPPAAVATLAPALIQSWAEMSKRGAFHSAADWASMDPLKDIGALQNVPTGIWCGTEDDFIGGVRRYIAEAHPAVAHTARGRHGDAFNRTVVAGFVSFLGKHAPKNAA